MEVSFNWLMVCYIVSLQTAVMARPSQISYLSRHLSVRYMSAGFDLESVIKALRFLHCSSIVK